MTEDFTKTPEQRRAEIVGRAFREHEAECDYRVANVTVHWERLGDTDYVPPRFCPFCGEQVHDMTYRPPERVAHD